MLTGSVRVFEESIKWVLVFQQRGNIGRGEDVKPNCALSNLTRESARKNFFFRFFFETVWWTRARSLASEETILSICYCLLCDWEWELNVATLRSMPEKIRYWQCANCLINGTKTCFCLIWSIDIALKTLTINQFWGKTAIMFVYLRASHRKINKIRTAIGMIALTQSIMNEILNKKYHFAMRNRSKHFSLKLYFYEFVYFVDFHFLCEVERNFLKLHFLTKTF